MTAGADRAANAAALANLRPPATLPSATPAFLEACAKLAAEANARGDFETSARLTDMARRLMRSTAG